MPNHVSNNLRRYAVVGAQQRLMELAEEVAQIRAAFPELRAGGFGRRAARTRAAEAPGQPAARKRRRRKMSAEGRKRISEAQKKRWAKQRAEK